MKVLEAVERFKDAAENVECLANHAGNDLTRIGEAIVAIEGGLRARVDDLLRALKKAEEEEI